MRALIPKEDHEKLVEDERTIYNESDFRFLLSHNGLRPGCLHLFLGDAGAGKSTLVRSIVPDFVARNQEKNCLVYLSEETEKEFIKDAGKNSFDGLGRVEVYSELTDSTIKDPDDVFKRMYHLYKEHRPDLLIYDNITTSKLYMDRDIKSQSEVAIRLKNMALFMKIPVVIFAHTGAEVTENLNRLISKNDIRGSKTIVNVAHFFYILQTFYVNENRFNTLRTLKHRGQHITESLFSLEFSEMGRRYTRDKAVDFSKFKELYKERNRL